MGEPGRGPLEAPLWQQLRVAAPAEQVALVAALARNAPLVFGDRPKEATFRRLASASAVELDAALGRQCVANFESLLPAPPIWHAQECDGRGGDDVFERVVLRERDAVLADSLRAEARLAGAGRAVVGVLGSAHLAEVGRLLAAAAGGFADDVEHLLEEPAEDPPTEGVRRALLERLLALRMPEEVAAEAQTALGALPPGEMAAYSATMELYGSSRMLLATLSPQQLPTFACAAGGVDLWAALQPLRDARPSNGGCGFSEQALAVARAGYSVPGM
jgi:hypothetical protein